MNDKQEVNCPICGLNSYEVLYSPLLVVDDPAKLYGAASGVRGTQRLVQCRACHGIYENPRYPDGIILKGYMSSNEAAHDSQYQMRVKSFRRALAALKKDLPSAGATVLDIGSAGGAFLEAAESLGYKSTGLEPSVFLVEQAKKRGLNIIQGTLDNVPLNGDKYDIVSLWDVLEHLTDPNTALLKIKSLLKPSGVLLINYPDIGTWMARIAGKRFWWISSVHLCHFSRETMSTLCRRAGYDVFNIKQYWQTLQFGYLQDVAIHYKIPFASFFKRVTPKFVKDIPISYYASQTTVLARITP